MAERLLKTHFAINCDYQKSALLFGGPVFSSTKKQNGSKYGNYFYCDK
jgi:hypothetical protein